MNKPKPTTCRDCAAGIYWAITPNGKKMPVDETPVEGGNVLLAIDAETGDLKAQVLKRDESAPEGRNTYTSHFKTCPRADERRRR